MVVNGETNLKYSNLEQGVTVHVTDEVLTSSQRRPELCSNLVYTVILRVLY
jgi:hypothetical protein